jgi:hypothetical protein
VAADEASFPVPVLNTTPPARDRLGPLWDADRRDARAGTRRGHRSDLGKRRSFLRAAGGLAGILAHGRAPAIARTGAAAPIFPEMGVFPVPNLISPCDQAYKVLNGTVGDKPGAVVQDKCGVKVSHYFDHGFRRIWNSERAINEPRNPRGSRIRTHRSKVSCLPATVGGAVMAVYAAHRIRMRLVAA